MNLKLVAAGAVLVLGMTSFAFQGLFFPSEVRSEPREVVDQHAHSGAARLEHDAAGRSAIDTREADAAAQARLMPSGIESVLKIGKTLRHGESVWDAKDVPTGSVQIWIDLRRQTISVFRAGHEIGSSIIAYGTEEHRTPLGSFTVLSKHRHYRSRRYDADMPFSLFITNDGVALHSSALHPRYATHGCIGLPDEFARNLFDVAEVGAEVNIVRSDSALVENLALAGTQSDR